MTPLLLTRPNLLKVLPLFSVTILTSRPVPDSPWGTPSTYNTRYPRFPGALVPESLGLRQSAVNISKRRTPRRFIAFQDLGQLEGLGFLWLQVQFPTPHSIPCKSASFPFISFLPPRNPMLILKPVSVLCVSHSDLSSCPLATCPTFLPSNLFSSITFCTQAFVPLPR